MLRRFGSALVLTLLCSAPALALSTTYALTMDGSQEVPGPGDPDGLASGTITLDDVTGDISWVINYTGLATVGAMHIHGPGGSAGSAAAVFVGLAITGSPGQLAGTTNTTPANIDAIFANPTDFYVNIHTSDFSNGAVRGQLGTVVPEPEAAQLFGLGTVALAVWRRLGRR
jgi:hypothetical protein